MTVVIGVLCEGGRAAVVAADRLIVRQTGDGQHLTFEGPESKIFRITPRVVAVYAGETPDKTIVERARESSQTPDATVYQVADNVRAARDAFRLARAAKSQLPPLWPTLDAFVQAAHAQADETVKNHLAAIKNSRLDLHFMVVGSDASGTHVYTINNAGEFWDHDDHGFDVMGGGTDWALRALVRGGYSKTLDLAQAIYHVYRAKKVAEYNNFVGEKTDLAVIRSGQDFVTLGPEEVQKLEDIYNRLNPATLPPADQEVIRGMIPG